MVEDHISADPVIPTGAVHLNLVLLDVNLQPLLGLGPVAYPMSHLGPETEVGYQQEKRNTLE